ncbi:MAG: glycosyltransferase [Candidatus Binatia bacterium]
MKPCRVLYVLKNFPQMSETYIKTEIEALKESCDIRIVSTKAANLPAKNHAPYERLTDLAAIREVIEEFRPDVLHSHWLHSVKILGKLSRLTGVPFTVRAHSFDSIWPEPYSVVERVPFLGAFRNPSHIRRALDVINGEFCLGVLNFPFARSRLERAGIRPDKLIDCYPVVNYRLFHNEGPNGDEIMNVGACIPKKRMEDFLDLAMAAPKMRFNLYALGYRVEELRELAKNRNSPVHFNLPLELEEMPAAYKQHRWLVYTAAPQGNVGWPLSLAEAQASGVGVCMANIRGDLRDYVGAAGFLYNTLDEALKIISQPFPEELRQLGFAQAKKSDAFEHRALLLDLWAKGQSKRSGSASQGN